MDEDRDEVPERRAEEYIRGVVNPTFDPRP
jgi:hypothetical protein